MFEFAWLHRHASGQSDAAATIRETLSFDPARILAAACFHLIDEGFASQINLSSREAAVRHLSERTTRLVIRRERWTQMSNVNRLQWLLVGAGLQVDISGEGEATFATTSTPDARDERTTLRWLGQ